MSGNFSDKYMKEFHEDAKFLQANCSGIMTPLFTSCGSGNFMDLNLNNQWDHGYTERVMCKFCDSIFYIDKEVSKCPSCGASHYKKRSS